MLEVVVDKKATNDQYSQEEMDYALDEHRYQKALLRNIQAISRYLSTLSPTVLVTRHNVRYRSTSQKTVCKKQLATWILLDSYRCGFY